MTDSGAAGYFPFQAKEGERAGREHERLVMHESLNYPTSSH